MKNAVLWSLRWVLPVLGLTAPPPHSQPQCWRPSFYWAEFYGIELLLLSVNWSPSARQPLRDLKTDIAVQAPRFLFQKRWVLSTGPAFTMCFMFLEDLWGLQRGLLAHSIGPLHASGWNLLFNSSCLGLYPSTVSCSFLFRHASHILHL